MSEPRMHANEYESEMIELHPREPWDLSRFNQRNP